MKKINFLLVISLYTTSYSFSQLICFSSAVNYAAGTSPRDITSADFNGDGHLDLATTNQNSNNISIHLGNGSGGFSTAANYVTVDGPRSILSADFNGDGKLDLVTANGGSGNISILLGNGFGGFSTANYFSAATGPISVTSADFNGDSFLDVASANYNSSNISIFLGNGSGGFATAINFNTGLSPFSIINADFNGDGFVDLTTANQGSTNVSVLLGNGTGGFSTATNFTVGQNPVSIISTDFNGDGFFDIATANINSNNISVLLGNGNGTFGSATNFPAGTNPRSIKTADVNNDLKKDLVVTNQGSNNVSVFLGNGVGSFISAVNFAVGTTPYSVTTGDFNEDSNIDFATANNYVNNVSVLLGVNSLTTTNTSSCYLGATGTATVYQTCGTPPFIYSWNTSPIQTSNTATGLSSGVYTVTVTDATNIPRTTSVTITDLPALNVSTTQTNILCAGTSTGSATATASGGTPPYYYSWNSTPAQSSSSATNLSAGVYTVTITDSKNCTKTANVTITQLPIISIATTQVNRSCAEFQGPDDGAATATISGGTPPYSYFWNTTPIQSNLTAVDLGIGNYSITVTDFNNCVKTGSVTITAPPEISISSSQTNVLCYGDNNGSVTANPAGGVAPYSFSWNTLPVQTSATISNLIAGNYSLTVTDANGCFSELGVTVFEPNPILTSFVYTPSQCSGSCTGELFCDAFGGTAPYFFQWNSFAGNQTNPVAVNLCPGTYTVQVTDANGCVYNSEGKVEANAMQVDSEIFLTNLAAVDQSSVSPSFASFYVYNLPTSISPPVTNPRNFVDPGKKARFKVESKNQKQNGQSVVSGICKVRSNCAYIEITDSSSALNNIGWNNFAWSADEFEIGIDPNTPQGTNAYIDFIIQENGIEYATTCISIPIHPLVYSPTTMNTIDDDNNPDSQGNNNDICEPGETIEFYPWLDNISTLDAEYVRGRFENLDNHGFINIWNGVAGVGTTVYDATWWNYSFAQPQTINPNSTNTTPEYDFVFDYNSSSTVSDFDLYMVMSGGFNLFNSNALSLVQWSLPYTFNSTGGPVSIDENGELTDQILIYPNPASNSLSIISNDGAIDRVIVRDLSGKICLDQNNLGNEYSLDVKNLSNGTYIIECNQNSRTTVKKLVIVH